MLKCEYCEKEFKTISNINYHQKTTLKNDTFLLDSTPLI